MLCINSGDNIVDTRPVLTDSIEGSEDGESSDDLTGGQIAHNGAESDVHLSGSQGTPNSEASLWIQINMSFF